MTYLRDPDNILHRATTDTNGAIIGTRCGEDVGNDWHVVGEEYMRDYTALVCDGCFEEKGE